MTFLLKHQMSNGFCISFLARNPNVVKRMVDSINDRRVKSVTEPRINRLMNIAEDVYQKFIDDPRKIFNVHDIAFQLQLTVKSTYAEKGPKEFWDVKS